MRYTVDMAECEDDRYNVVDTFTNTRVVANVPAETAESMVDHRNREFKEASEVADCVARFLNGTPRQEDSFVAAMGREHRTLQQNFTRLCRAWFEHLAALEHGDYDGRNQGSVEMAKALVKTDAWQKAGLPYI